MTGTANAVTSIAASVFTAGTSVPLTAGAGVGAGIGVGAGAWPCAVDAEFRAGLGATRTL